MFEAPSPSASEPIPVLDHGYVKLISTWGSDENIISAARMSTDGAFRGWGKECDTCAGNAGIVDDKGDYQTCPNPKCKGGTIPGDEKLLHYLYTNKHLTPFEMAGMQIEVSAPIFVFREWHRHRTQSYNELSARYTPLPDVNYVPSVERLTTTGASKQQQGTSNTSLTTEGAIKFRQVILELYNLIQSEYFGALNAGVPKELARIIVPVGRYSRMRAQANLRNWLQFLELRLAPNAQWEIRQYANAVSKLVSTAFPRTHALFTQCQST